MGKTKSAVAAKAGKDAQVKSISSVKGSAVTKSSQTPKAKSKEVAMQVVVKVDNADKKSKKKGKEPTPVSISESENESDDGGESSASSASSDEEAPPVPVKAAKTNGVKSHDTKTKNAVKIAAKSDTENSESSESSENEDEPAAPKAKAVAGAKDESDSDEGTSEGTSEGASEGSSEEESDDDEAPEVSAPLDAKTLNGKLAKATSNEAIDGKSDSGDSSSGTSESSSDEEESEEEAPAPKKRKAEAETTAVSKKAKTDPGNDDEAKKNLFIGHLSYNVDEEWLTREFEKFGELTRVKVVTDRESGQSRGFGYVEFANPADGVKAQAEMHEADIDGRGINVDFSKPKDAATPRQDRQKSYGDSLSVPSETIFVANLPFDVSEDVVGEEFGKHGNVLGVRLPTDMNTGAPKGFGYVQFASVEESQEVFGKMAGATIMGRPVRLDYSTPRPPRNDDSPRGRGGRGGFGDRGGRGGGRGRGGFDRGGRGGGRGGFDRGRGGRGGSTNRGGVGEFKGKKINFNE